MSRGANRPRRYATATAIGMVTDLRVALRVRTGSSTRTAPSSPGDWANADGGSGLDVADHGEHELEGCAGARRLFTVKD